MTTRRGSTDWMAQSLCAQIGASADWDPWYPERGGRFEMAERICAGCPVRVECLEYGFDDPWGWWGGVSPEARARMRAAEQGKVAA